MKNQQILCSSWVRKLIGKPAFLTIADCESEARRIHSPHAGHFSAHASRAFRIQSDLLSEVLATAATITRCSSGDSLALTIMPRFLAFGTFGLPIFDFI